MKVDEYRAIHEWNHSDMQKHNERADRSEFQDERSFFH
jgi:hypothetical protein